MHRCWRQALLAVAMLSACGLDAGGEATPDGSVTGGSAGASGSGGTSGHAAGGSGGGGWPDAASGNAGQAATDSGAAGEAGGPVCAPEGYACGSSDSVCCSGHCGAIVPLDCDSQGACVACNSNDQCASGRCDACACNDPLDNGAACDEASDCVSARCADSSADANDCDQPGLCAACDADDQCESERCDGCECVAKLGFGDACDEGTDCDSGSCGKAPTSANNDCATVDECVDCQFDGDCPSGRCDDCKCEQQLSPGSDCNENSDCSSDDCLPSSKCK